MSAGNGEAGGAAEPASVLLGIGVFARRSRLSMKALRLYDRLGLLPPADVDPRSGYRRYRESQVETARLIALLRRLDMPLAQVAEVIAAPRGRGAELVADHWAAVERRVAGQRELAAHVRSQLSGGGQERLARFVVRVREVPDQQVLTEQRHVLVSELETWSQAATERLTSSARALGGVAGAVFRIFYGEVNEDSDGPVEVCVPIDPAVAGRPEAAVRREPAHREAYVRLTPAQYEFPQVLSAYEAVERWIDAQGATYIGAPREIDLVPDGYATALTESPTEVCDVAYPIR
jgi:DNA-binding transcriptional MerR regulator